MGSFSEVIALWPSVSEFAADVGVTYNVANQWPRRNSIPPGWWAAVVAAAERRRLGGVSLELLARLAAERAGADARSGETA